MKSIAKFGSMRYVPRIGTLARTLVACAAVSIGICALSQDSVGRESNTISATQFSHTTIYHSPQSPGFTCWTGAYLLPDQSLIVCFTQATGPIGNRRKTPAEVRDRLSWPPNDAYDMNGLDLQNIHLRSTDVGTSWQQISGDHFRSPMNYVTGNGATALSDGTIVRGVWGFYLPFDKKPRTGFVERSRDLTRSWSDPIVLLDPAKYATFPTRLRLLRDGRLLLLGGLSRAPAIGDLTRNDHWAKLEPLMMTSSDGGLTWQGPLEVIPEIERKNWRCEEYDAAELASGDLLCVFRRANPAGTGEVRWQAVLKKNGKVWKTDSIGPAPFPHSGHPELLTTKEGPVLLSKYPINNSGSSFAFALEKVIVPVMTSLS